MHTDLYPDPARPQHLLTELVAFFASLDAVLAVEVFGSLARGEWDRWSDVDLIVVTGNRAQFREVFDHRCECSAHKPVFYLSLLSDRHRLSHGGRVRSFWSEAAKNAKRILRGGEDRDSLRTWAKGLNELLQKISADQQSGLIRFAHGYQQIAEAVLTEEPI